jgi:hypothetical protein
MATENQSRFSSNGGLIARHGPPIRESVSPQLNLAAGGADKYTDTRTYPVSIGDVSPVSRPRLHQYGHRKPCYFCGAPGPSSAEHAPPQAFFEGTECDRITVPACDQHNENKAGPDNAIKAALVNGADLLISTGTRVDIPDDVRRTIEAMRHKYRWDNSLVTMKRLVSDHPDDAGIELSYLHGAVKLNSWAKMLTAALVWSVTGTHDSGTDWEKAGAFSPCYLPAGSEELLTPEMLAEKYGRRLDIWRELEDGTPWRPGWQPHPRAYSMAIYSVRCAVRGNGRRTRCDFPALLLLRTSLLRPLRDVGGDDFTHEGTP